MTNPTIEKIEAAEAAFSKLEELLVNFAIDVCMGQERLAINWQEVMHRDFHEEDLKKVRQALGSFKALLEGGECS